MDTFVIFIAVIMAFFIGVIIGVISGKNYCDDGTLYIYPDEKNRMCTVASFTEKTVMRLQHKDTSFNSIHMDVKHLDPATRNNISSYNEESSTTVL